ncbi:hypothetical protein ACFL4K_03280, partial [Candidatus Neomarinimicrobiota bacterium]
MSHYNPFRLTLLCLAAAFAFSGCATKQPDYASQEKIDAHVHIRYSGPEVLAQAAANNFKLISIMVDHGESADLMDQRKFTDRQQQIRAEQIAYITAFPIEGWDDADWVVKTIAYLAQEFENGAIGVKVWKNIGMVFQDLNGAFVMLDDPKFDPIIDFIEAQGKTLTGHIGEPRDCWLPLEEMVATSNR